MSGGKAIVLPITVHPPVQSRGFHLLLPYGVFLPMEMYHAVAKEVLAAREAKVLEVANVKVADVEDLEADWAENVENSVKKLFVC